jgi:ubiquinone/menaquinone biosynthesis C-methylase UbiE
MQKVAEYKAASRAAGLVLHAAGFYDVMIWLRTLGREQTFRHAILRLAHLEPGESVLDVGCGTGTLAIAAKKAVGPIGLVCGIDASPEMLARAEKKSRAAGLDVAFRNAPAQALPFPDAQFDVVFSTLMLHHLPRTGRAECAREVRRVLKPGGRALAVDFAAPAKQRRRSLIHMHRHGHLNFGEMFGDAGLQVVANGAVGYRNLQFVLATAG